MSRGTAAGLLTTLGVSLGLSVYAALSLFGLSAILIEFEWLAWTVRALGGCYLVCLGIMLLRSKPSEIGAPPAAAGGPTRPLVFGFLVTMTNPKAVVLFTSVFATSVTQATSFGLMGLMIGLVFACSLIWYAAVSLFMSSRAVIDRFRNARHWIERTAGACFIGVGGRILVDTRNPISP